MLAKSIFIIVSIVIGSLFLFLFMNNEQKVTDFPTKDGPIVAFGDSLVEGVGASAGHTFVDLLSKRIDEPIINLGVSGNTTADGLMRIRELEAEDPRLVLLLLGGNDALRRLPLEDTFANLSQFIEALQEKKIAVLLIGISGGISYARSYEEAFENLADKYGVAYVPNILKGLFGRSEYMADAIHPNDAGNVRMADKIEPVLRYLLEK